MGARDKRIDAYIAKSADFAKPVLTHLREVVHSACPDVEEALKWSTPAFVYHDGILCHMAAFKQHCSFGFWKASLIFDTKPDQEADAAGQFGRITSVKDLPSKKELSGYIRKAMKLNEQGITVAKKLTPAAKKSTVYPVPVALSLALKKNKKAQAVFDAFSPSHRKEYSEWVADAKSEDTRTRRIKQAVEWIADGKGRNWKYRR